MSIEREFAQALEVAFPQFPFVAGFDSLLARRLHVLRLLAYDPADGRPTLAKPHFDRDFATLHICETDPGLFHGPECEEVPYVARDDRIFIFAGDKAQLFTGGHAHAAWYEQTGEKKIEGGIIKPRRHVVRSGVAHSVRYSAVFFGHIGTPERPCELPWK